MPFDKNHPHIHRLYVRPGARALCIHFDPDRLSLEKVKAIARQSGGELADRFGHLLFEVQGSLRSQWRFQMIWRQS